MKVIDLKNGIYTFQVEKIVTEEKKYSLTELQAQQLKLMNQQQTAELELNQATRELEQINELLNIINGKSA